MRRRAALALVAALALAGPHARFARATGVPAVTEAARGTRAGPDSLLAWFDRAWSFAHATFYDTTTVTAQLTDENRARLRALAATLGSREELAAALSQFFQSAGFSHTGVYTPHDLDWWVLRDSRRPAPVEPWHSGAMFARGPDGWSVRNVLDGLPAAAVGLRRGDVVLTANGAPFHPFDSFAGGSPVRLAFRRGGRRLERWLRPVRQEPLQSFRAATLRSARTLVLDGHRVGIVHLWCCLGTDQVDALREALRDSLAGCDGVVLDLRDGYGGLFNEFVDLFYPSRDTRVTIPFLDRGGWHSSIRPDLVGPHYWFAGPVVAVVNEGTRSAKEVLAYQLQFTHRALLVGSRTAGSLCTAGVGFGDAARELLVEVPASRLLLAGQQIEGVGVAPDVEAPWPLERACASRGDPQLDAALQLLRERLKP